MQSILDILKGQSLHYYDVETYGSVSADRQQIYSASYRTEGKSSTRYFDINKKGASPHTPPWIHSIYEKSEADIEKARSAGKLVSRTDRSSETAKFFLDPLRGGSEGEANILIGHNIKFDLKQTFAQMKGYDKELPDVFHILDMSSGRSPKATSSASRIDSMQSLKQLKKVKSGKDVDHVLKLYLNPVKEAIQKGKAGILDTQTLTSIAMAKAEHRGDLGIKYNGDYSSGVKLGFLDELIQFSTDKEKWKSNSTALHHKSDFDTSATERVFKWLTEEAYPQIFNESGVVSDSVHSVLSGLQMVKEQGWQRIQARRNIGQYVYESHMPRPFQRAESSAGGRGGRRDIHIAFSGSRKRVTSSVIDNPQEFAGILSGMGTYQDWTHEELVQEVTDWNAKAKANLTDPEKGLKGFWNEIQASTYKDERTHIRNILLDPDYQKNVSKIKRLKTIDQSHFNVPTTKGINTRNKILTGVGIAAGLWAAYNIVSNGSETNHGRGKDNIQGLHPGDGVNKENIQRDTDFGSGFKSFFFGKKPSDAILDILSRYKVKYKDIRAAAAKAKAAGVKTPEYGITGFRAGSRRVNGVNTYSGEGTIGMDWQELEVRYRKAGIDPSLYPKMNTVAMAHETFEAHHFSRLWKSRSFNDYGSHYSPAVIADEALFAKSLGDDAFQSMARLRRSEEKTYSKRLLSDNKRSERIASRYKEDMSLSEKKLDQISRIQREHSRRIAEAESYLGNNRPSKIYENVDSKWDLIREHLSGRNSLHGRTGKATSHHPNVDIVERNSAIEPIEGLHPPGESGMATALIRGNTPFGSKMGWVGTVMDMLKDSVIGLKDEVIHNPGFAIGGAAIGLAKGYQKGKEEGEVSFSRAAKNIAIDMVDDVLVFGGPALMKALTPRIPGIQKYQGTMDKILKVVEHPYVKKAGVTFFGYTMGHLVGEFLGKSSGKDDPYNTIEALHHGWYGAQRKENTDFGSGYQGPVAPIHHPELQEDYNEATDIPAYKLFRASSIGLSEEEIYQKMTTENKKMSRYVEATAAAGTALHKVLQAEEYKKGNAYDAEVLTYNQQYGVSGHVDVITPAGVGDYKSVNNGIYQTILKTGPKPMHKSQVNFYLGSTGMDQGFIQYINRDRPNQKKNYLVQFNPYQYEQDLKKVERARKRVELGISEGTLQESKLPKGASLERLRNQNKERESPEEQVSQLPNYKQMYQEEMAYMKTTQRGMPAGGPGKQRIQDRNKRKRDADKKERDSKWAYSTQGIGLQSYRTRNKHNIM